MSRTRSHMPTGPARDPDPNVLQWRASDPACSVWVGASAGTGKTKVLTDRVLRLLLPGRAGEAATPPHRILGLTFTRAGAAEMVTRINGALADWAVVPDDTLTESLQKLTGHPPSQDQKEAARRLFAQVTDTPGGLKIMTIHAFCQSVLGRFPLEAGVSPHFSLIEEGEAALFLERAQRRVLEGIRLDPDCAEAQALQNISTRQNESQFAQILSSLSAERGQLQKILAAHGTPDKCKANLYRSLGVRLDETDADITLAFCGLPDGLEEKLRHAVRVLAKEGAAKDMQRAVEIQEWLDKKDPVQRQTTLESYKLALLTKTDTPRKTGKKIADTYPDIVRILEEEGRRLQEMEDHRKALGCAELSFSLLLFGGAVLREYEAEKKCKAALDYNDLIIKTLDLLESDGGASWVMYKLDGGIDHILVDEAQDTNPEQWQIIQALCADFFAGYGREPVGVRTLFAVGDAKQSIYSFHRAAPEKFDSMRRFFAEKSKACEGGWRDEALTISFRSTRAVLSVVDAVFAPDEMRAGLGQDLSAHKPFRRGQAGRVELWPLYEAQSDTPPPWTPPVDIVETRTAQAQLADDIAVKIRGWLDRKEILPSKARAVRPGDIMILVRTRTAFMSRIVSALKSKNIPVSGVDRMVLNEQIAVQDLLALAQFALFPDDDLTLASLLKSPLIGYDEETLYALCRGRPDSLWQALQCRSGQEEVVAYLRDLLAAAEQERPYEFFGKILQMPCPADHISGLRALQRRLGEECLDPVEEFVSATLEYEAMHSPTLQGFVHWQMHGRAEIKREQEEAGGKVRVMTVHGAKGLQAPIVILPDTTRAADLPAGKTDFRLLWPDKTGLDIPLWSPRKELDCRLYTDALDRYRQAQNEEYRRLLYVALTRAEDRLYIGGAFSPRVRKDSWYYAIEKAVHNHPDAIERQGDIWSIDCPQTANPDGLDEKADMTGTSDMAEEDAGAPPPAKGKARPQISGWPFLYEPAPYEQKEKAAPAPSQPVPLSSESTFSPLGGAQSYRFRRGEVTHKLLEYLPDLPAGVRRDRAGKYVEKYAGDLPDHVRDDIVNETLCVLEDPQFAPLFGPGSLAEVPISGRDAAGTLVNAQVDRLLVTQDAVFVIDYKTNRPRPQSQEEIPSLYLKQMRAYRDILRAVYPGRAVHCALLWTDGPVLMRLF